MSSRTLALPVVLVASLGLAACGGSSSSSSSTAATTTTTAAASPAVSVPASTATTPVALPSASSSATGAATAAQTTAATSASATAASTGAVTSSPATTVSAAGGSTLAKGTGYTVTVPQGWKKQTSSTSELGYSKVTSGQALAFAVSVHGGASITVDQAAKAVKDASAKDGSKDIHIASATTLDGTKAVPVIGTETFGTTKARVADVVAIHGGKGYEVVLISSTAKTDAQLLQQFQPVLSSWHWQA